MRTALVVFVLLCAGVVWGWEKSDCGQDECRDTIRLRRCYLCCGEHCHNTDLLDCMDWCDSRSVPSTTGGNGTTT